MQPSRLSLSLALTSSVVLTTAITLPPAHAQTFIPAANRLTASDGTSNNNFGESVALSGNTALMGAEGAIGGNASQGAAYLFNTTTGAQTAKLIASDGVRNNYFGTSVALSGNTALVGAFGDTVGGYSGSGSAYLFDAATGAQRLKLTVSDPFVGQGFGSSVFLSGNTALIGAYGYDVTRKSIAKGAAFLFDTNTGVQTALLTASDGGDGDYFGSAVAQSGNTVLVGALAKTVGGRGYQGAAYVFNATTGAQTAKLTASDGTNFGNSVALSGNLALIGAFNSDVGGNAEQGAAYLFDVTTGEQLFKFTASDGAANDNFGVSVALSGNFALIGAYGNNSNRGAVYAFDLGTHQQAGKYLAADGMANDRFGNSVAINGTNALAGADGSNSMQGSAYRFGVGSAAAPEPGSIALALTPGLPITGWIFCRQKRRRQRVPFSTREDLRGQG